MEDKYDVRFNLIEEITEDDIRELIKQVNEIHQNTTFTTKDFLMFLIPVLFIFTVAMLVLLFI
tara:strand:- start:1916 stop:2104 length:189 start_codon:yes stop_codon:yes gene_type:complete